MAELNYNCLKMKKELEKRGLIVHYQKEPSFSVHIEVDGNRIEVPFTNSTSMWYLLSKKGGKLLYVDRSLEEDIEAELKIWLDLYG